MCKTDKSMSHFNKQVVLTVKKKKTKPPLLEALNFEHYDPYFQSTFIPLYLAGKNTFLVIHSIPEQVAHKALHDPSEVAQSHKVSLS